MELINGANAGAEKMKEKFMKFDRSYKSFVPQQDESSTE